MPYQRPVEPSPSVPMSFMLKQLFSRLMRYIVIIFIIGLFIFLSQGIILVREGEMAVLIKKTGEDLTNYNKESGQYNYLLSCPMIAPSREYKGIQKEPLAEGWHFYNPYIWDYEIHRQTVISNGEVGILLRLFGQPLNPGEYQNLAGPDQMGILKEVLMPGQHLINPYAYKLIKKQAIQIGQGYRGVVTYLAGKVTTRKLFVTGDIKDPQKLALSLLKKERSLDTYLLNVFPVDLQKNLKELSSKTIRTSMLAPLNKILQEKNLYTKERFAGIQISRDSENLLKKADRSEEETIQLNRWLLADGYSEALERTSFLVAEGERGVCEEVLVPGTYYFNPYEKVVEVVDIRSHRFDLTEQNQAIFPSFDGFPILMEGNIEWLIHPDRIAEVFVKYRDERDIIGAIVEKVILPNARAFIRLEGSKYLARDFISGQTREKFQSSFDDGMSKSCEKEGIIIKASRITKCTPPDKICNPIQQKEIAIREREKYTQEIGREKEQIKLKVESERKELEVRKIKAMTEVEVAKTNAHREKEVAVIHMNQLLEVAKRRLEAAKNEAAAIIVAAQAEAEVVRLQNKAEASGISDARLAFGTGKNYANFLLLQKVSLSLSSILANTDSPFLNIFKETGKLEFKSRPQKTEQHDIKKTNENKGE